MGATPDTKLPVFATLGFVIVGLILALALGMGKSALAGGVVAGLGIIPACWGMWVGMQQERQGSLGASIGVFMLALATAGILIVWGIIALVK